MRPFSLVVLLFAAPAGAAIDSEFVGTTPCHAPVRELLGIPAREPCDTIRWRVRLEPSSDSRAARAVVEIVYGLGKRLRSRQHVVPWSVGAGMPGHAHAVVYLLTLQTRQLPLWRITGHTVYLLDPQRRLLVGDSGRSYSLTAASAVQRPAVKSPAEFSYQLTPLDTGPEVYGVFEGRTPCDIAPAIGIDVEACIKLKWRLTLYQAAGTRVPDRYKLEGALFPRGPRAGKATPIAGGTPFDPDASVLALAAPAGQGPIYLMRGDENVWFLLDADRQLPPGGREFGYALNRRANL